MNKLKSFLEEQKLLNEKYPNRDFEIHEDYCKHCPSHRNAISGVIDPESQDIKESYSKGYIAREALFVCAWRQNKLCKGICEFMGIDQEYLNELNKEEMQARTT